MTMTTMTMTMTKGSRGRGDVMGFALDAIQWIHSRRAPFNTRTFEAEMGCCRRTALRWLYAIEARNHVEHFKLVGDRRTWWRRSNE